MSQLLVIYRRSRNLGSFLIRAFTWGSQWSHAGIWDVERDHVIEASASHGVVATPVSEFLEKASEAEIVAIDCPRPELALQYAREQIGKPYDWGAIFGIVFREPWYSDEKWFCFELVEAALMAGGRQRFRKDSNRITGNLSYLTL